MIQEHLLSHAYKLKLKMWNQSQLKTIKQGPDLYLQGNTIYVYMSIATNAI